MKLLNNLPVWEKLAKHIIWAQLGKIEEKDVLDFGSGTGVTADYFAENNNVIAVEPNEEMLKKQSKYNDYTQLIGSIDRLRELDDESFDVIICHNVLEYAEGREQIVNEFYRLLRRGGTLSIVKHNRNGRVMQMAVLLNDFETANNLLDGQNGNAKNFGTINYYDDEDILNWCADFTLDKKYGLRTFWDLQQNQEIQQETEWQRRMIELEMRVSECKDFQNIAFLHHLIFRK